MEGPIPLVPISRKGPPRKNTSKNRGTLFWAGTHRLLDWTDMDWGVGSKDFSPLRYGSSIVLLQVLFSVVISVFSLFSLCSLCLWGESFQNDLTRAIGVACTGCVPYWVVMHPCPGAVR